jgi:hypothetical protein
LPHQVDLDRPFDVVQGLVLDQPIDGDGRIVDPGVDPAEMADGFLREPLDLVPLRDIGDDDVRSAASLFDRLGNILKGGLIACRQDDAGLMVAEQQCCLAADSLRRAGDDDDLFT